MRSYTVTRASMARLRRPSRAVSMGRSAALLVMVFVLLATQTGQGRAPAAPLNFFKNYFVTGDYRVYGVPIKGSPASGGFTTKDITIPSDSVPAGAELVAAYLYWSAVVARDESRVGQRRSAVRWKRPRASCEDPESHRNVTVLELGRGRWRRRR